MGSAATSRRATSRSDESTGPIVLRSRRAGDEEQADDRQERQEGEASDEPHPEERVHEAVVRAADSARVARRTTAIYLVAGFTGLRLGELRALRWQDVDFAKRPFTCVATASKASWGVPKSGKVRSVPMPDQVLAALDKLSRRGWYVDPECLVFATPVGTVLQRHHIAGPFSRALERAGLKPIRFHDLRHSFGTMAVQVFPLSDVRAYMGHADIQTTMRFVHHVPQHDAAEKLSRLIGSEDVPQVVPNTPDLRHQSTPQPRCRAGYRRTVTQGCHPPKP